MRTKYAAKVAARSGFNGLRGEAMTFCLVIATLMWMEPGAFGATYIVSPAQSQSDIQKVISTAKPGDAVQFLQGLYTINSPLYLACDVSYSGPDNGFRPNGLPNPATAELTAPLINGHFSLMYASACDSLEISWLHFENASGIHFDIPGATIAGTKGVNVVNSQFSSLPDTGSAATNAAIYIGADVPGINGGYLANLTVAGNTIGDTNSCVSPTDAMDALYDAGGACAGVYFRANVKNILIANNSFFHVEQGIKALCTQGQCDPMPPYYDDTTAENFIVINNDFRQIHRMPIEFQFQPNLSPITIAFNSIRDLYKPFRVTTGISGPCCNHGGSGYTLMDNVLIADQDGSPYIAYGEEFWGGDSQALGNLVEGYWANGITWGNGGPGWAITNNYICGPNMGALNSYITDEEHSSPAPVISANVENPACTAIITMPPRISTMNGAVVLTDYEPNGSIYYTTDGSTPTVNSTLYSAPFQVPTGGTVKAIAMWGRGANPTSYPPGYGYVPSAVVSMLVSQGSPEGKKELTAAFLRTKDGIDQVRSGGTAQFLVYAVYSDGSSGLLPDSSGQSVNWNTSDHAIAKVSAHGHVTGIAPGTVMIKATIGSVQATPSLLTVKPENAAE